MARVQRSHLLIGALGLVVIAGTFLFVLPEIASYRSIIGRLDELTAPETALLAALAVVNVLTFAPPLQAALPGLGFRRALSSSQISAAFSHAVPAGDAIGIGVQVALYRRWGFGTQPIAVALTLVGVANGLFFVIIPPLALVLLALSGERRIGLLLLAFGACALLIGICITIVAAIRHEQSAGRFGNLAARLATPILRVFHRGPPDEWGEHVVDFRLEGISVLRRRWWALMLGTLASNLAVFACVVVSLRLVGATPEQLSIVEILVAWSLTRLLLLIPITPGGTGIVELGMTGLLIAFGGDSIAVVAGVLLERALTFVPPIIIGAVCGLKIGVSRRGQLRNSG